MFLSQELSVSIAKFCPKKIKKLDKLVVGLLVHRLKNLLEWLILTKASPNNKHSYSQYNGTKSIKFRLKRCRFYLQDTIKDGNRLEYLILFEILFNLMRIKNKEYQYK